MADSLPVSLSQEAPDIYAAATNYSREATVASIKSYFEFLIKMYLPAEAVVMPPDGGWPDMDNILELGKSEEVVDLLRHLPYITLPPDGAAIVTGEVHFAGACEFANWADIAQQIAGLPHPLSTEDARKTLYDTQWDYGPIPSSVIGLTSSKDFQMFLDTRFGVVYFIGQHAAPVPRILVDRTDELYPPIRDSPESYAPRQEASWRDEKAPCAWAIPDFFKLLEFHFRELNYVPTGRWEVEEGYDEDDPNGDAAEGVPRIKNIFREHGWPDVERYRKDECIEAVEREWQQYMEM